MQNNINVLQKLKDFLNKVTEILKFTEEQRNEFIQNMVSGFVFNVLSETKEVASPEIQEKIKKVFETPVGQMQESDAMTTIEAYFKEISEKEEGQNIIIKNFEQIVTKIMEESGDSFTEDQIDEIANVLSA